MSACAFFISSTPVLNILFLLPFNTRIRRIFINAFFFSFFRFIKLSFFVDLLVIRPPTHSHSQQYLLQSSTMYSCRLQLAPVQLRLLTMYCTASSFSYTHSAPIQFIRRCLRGRSLYLLRTSTSLCSICVPHATLHFYHPLLLSALYTSHFIFFLFLLFLQPCHRLR